MKYLVNFKEIRDYENLLKNKFPHIYKFLDNQFQYFLYFAINSFREPDQRYTERFIEELYQHIDTVVTLATDALMDNGQYNYNDDAVMSELYSYDFAMYLNNFLTYVKNCMFDLFRENEFIVSDVIQTARDDLACVDIDFLSKNEAPNKVTIPASVYWN